MKGSGSRAAREALAARLQAQFEKRKAVRSRAEGGQRAALATLIRRRLETNSIRNQRSKGGTLAEKQRLERMIARMKARGGLE